MDSRISESRKASKNGEFNSLSLSGFDQEEVSMSASSSSPISVVSNGFGTSLGSPKSSAPPGFSLEANGSEAGVSSQGGNLILAGSHAPPVREKEQQSDSVPASGIKEGPEEPESGIIGASLGAAAGGIVGGIAGGLVGGVVGAIGGTLGGAVLGGLAGNAIENAMLPVVEGILSPQDNFAGRSTTNFGLGEVIDLSFRSTATAASMGGLKWEIKSGGGKLSNLTSNGSGDYTCGGTVGAVTLELKIETGSNAGHVMASKNLNIVAPNDALMERDGRAVRHENNKWSAGFYGEMFMRPKNVSF
ncbi:MAG TPA: hypothetical protein ENJ82_13965, partial [Bacteroidetes bacterium]|nr:hypothetical protein [Bacteroidota bacterium]